MPHRPHIHTKKPIIDDEETTLSPESAEAEPVSTSHVADLEEKVANAMDRLLRMQAEMDNVRRRSERDVENAHKFALERFVNDLLPIIDGLERALAAHAGEDSASGSLLDGVGLTLRMLYTTFNKFGIQSLDPKGSAFNPEHHQAVSTSPSSDVAPGTVVEVLQKGYLLNDRLVRPALVVVAGNGRKD